MTEELVDTEIRECPPEAYLWSVNDVSYALATIADSNYIVNSLYKMLQELQPLGHDVLPTIGNVEALWRNMLEPAVKEHTHGIYIATANDVPIGVTFFVPEVSAVETPPNRAIAFGIYVDPAWRHRGVASALQEKAHLRLKELGFEQLISYVVADNVAGLASARKAGAKITGFMTTVYL